MSWTLSKEDFVNADILVCENASVWDTSNIKEPKNLSKPFQEKKITINFALPGFHSKYHADTSDILGGPTGLWATENFNEFEKCEISGFYSWIVTKEFKNCEFEWFHNNETFYFNAKGNVYSRINKEPFYEMVWENRQIIQMNGGMANDSNFSGCLLDNGQVWALDNSEFEIFSYGESEFTQNNSGWIHLDFYDDKKVKSILAMESAIYVLCESPEQKLYYHCNGPQIQTEYDEDEEEINNSPPLEPEDPLHPVEDKSMSSKTIIKMVCISEIIFCWCEEGLYAWVVDNGATPFPFAEDHPVCKYSRQFYPFKFFENKNILDIGASLHFYVLCDDGVYTIPSSFEDDGNTLDVQIIPIKLSFFDENIPLMFSSYFNSKRKLGKSARSTLTTEEEPPAKKQKLLHKEEKTDI